MSFLKPTQFFLDLDRLRDSLFDDSVPIDRSYTVPLLNLFVRRDGFRLRLRFQVVIQRAVLIDSRRTLGVIIFEVAQTVRRRSLRRLSGNLDEHCIRDENSPLPIFDSDAVPLLLVARRCCLSRRRTSCQECRYK
ncbi:hypothetical protein ACIXFK_17460 [Bacteroides fragilis]